MPKSTRKKYIEDLDPIEFMAVLDEGGRKFNEECDRLGISRVIEIDGETVLYHPDGSYTPMPDPDDREAVLALFRQHKVSLDGVRGDSVMENGSKPSDVSSCVGRARHFSAEPGATPAPFVGQRGSSRPHGRCRLLSGQRGAAAQARGNRMRGHDHVSGLFACGLAGTSDCRVAAGNFALFAR